MSDFGNTGIHVTPKAPTEDEMNLVRDILQRAVDSIVGMSQLHADVEMLRSTVSGLQADTDRLRQTNANLDEALAYTRKERDEARERVSTIKQQALKFENEANSFSHSLLKLQDEHNVVVSQLADAKRERDDHGFKVMELEEALKQAEAKLAKLAEAHASVFGLPIPMSPPVQDPHPIQAVNEALPEPSADPKPWEPEQGRTYHGLSWSPGYIWDDVKGEYYSLN